MATCESVCTFFVVSSHTDENYESIEDTTDHPEHPAVVREETAYHVPRTPIN